MWIGYTRRHDTLNFLWVDGSPEGYKDWAPDQPIEGDGWIGQKHCAYTGTQYLGTNNMIFLL